MRLMGPTRCTLEQARGMFMTRVKEPPMRGFSETTSRCLGAIVASFHGVWFVMDDVYDLNPLVLQRVCDDELRPMTWPLCVWNVVIRLTM